MTVRYLLAEDGTPILQENGSPIILQPSDDLFPAYLGTPEYRTPTGDYVTVSRVEVLFTSHATRSDLANHFDVYVQQYDALEADEPLAPGVFTPGDSEVDADGVMVAGGVTIGSPTSFDEAPPELDHRRRILFHLHRDSLPAPAIRVLIANMRGVSIREILVYGERIPAPRP